MRTILIFLAMAPLCVNAAQAQAQSPGVRVAPALVGELQSAIVNGRWTSRRAAANRCPKLYVLMQRTCPYSKALLHEQLVGLDRAGYDLRVHVVPAVNEPAGPLAEVGLRRDVRLSIGYLDGARLAGAHPSVREDGGFEAYNAMVETARTYRKISRQAGFPNYTPSILWEDRPGQWRIVSGYEKSMMPALRTSLVPPGPGCATPPK